MMIRFMRLLAPSGLVLACLASSQSARATFMVSATTGGSAEGGAIYSNLDARATNGTTQTTNTGLTVGFNGNGSFVTGSSPNQFQAPIISGGNNTFFETTPPPTTPTADTTVYASTGTGSATLTFATGPQFYLGLLWGSVDAYNTLTFLDASGNTVGSFTGAQIDTIAGSNPTGTVYANFNSTVAFTSVVASSTQASFEFDNVAFSNVVPEPSSMALSSIAGVIGVVVARKRAKRAVA